MRLHQSADDRQTKAYAAVMDSGSIEPIEEARALLGWYTGTSVLNLDSDRTDAGMAQPEPDGGAIRTVPAGVAQEVIHDLADGCGIREDVLVRRVRRVQPDRLAAAAQERAGHVDRLVEDGLEWSWSGMHRQPAGLDRASGQEIFQHFMKAAGIPTSGAQYAIEVRQPHFFK